MTKLPVNPAVVAAANQALAHGHSLVLIPRTEAALPPEWQALHDNTPQRVVIASNERVAASLPTLTSPEVELSTLPGVGFLRHQVPGSAMIIFLANTTNQPRSGSATFQGSGTSLELWDAATGEMRAINTQAVRNGLSTTLRFEPYQSYFIVMTNGPGASMPTTLTQKSTDPLRAWTIQFDDEAAALPVAPLVSWTDLPNRRGYAGRAIYRTTVKLPARLEPKDRYILDFGSARPIPIQQARDEDRFLSQAWLEPPVREAAEVFVNNQRVQALWQPPYEVDITAEVTPGANHIEIRVYNLLVNRLALLPPEDYSALTQRYGRRFDPQELNLLQAVPAGILEPVELKHLIESPAPK